MDKDNWKPRKQRIFWKSLLTGLLAGGTLLEVSGNGEAGHGERPNILFILVDDQRNDTLGCAGHPVIQTPHIDRLAHDGVRFENAFVTTSICMASRATILTGLTETGHGFTGGPFPATPLLKEDIDTSFPMKLREVGYRTGFFGKVHLRFHENKQTETGRLFDEFQEINRNPYFKELPDGTQRHEADLIGDLSVEFLEDQPKEQPFFLYMSFNIAHAEDSDHRPGAGHFPWPPSVDGMYEDIDPAPPRLGDERYFDVHPDFLKNSMNRERWHWRWDTPEKYRLNMRAYYRMLTGLDKVVARVHRKLEDLGLADNTVVIYTADNGFYMGDRGFAGKWSHYEESLRVPLIVYDPRLPEGKRGRVVPDMALNLDLPSTIVELAGVEIPEKYQGRSLLPIIQGETPHDWRTDFFCEHRYNHEKLPKWRGVRGEHFTYAHYYEEDYEFLFDLNRDPTQFQNLAKDPNHRSKLEQLRARAKEFEEKYTRPEVVSYKKTLQ
jgi:arylsulfatase A-like enzyme